MTLDFTVPRLTPTVNTWSRLHWRGRHRLNDTWRLEVLAGLGRARGDWPVPPPRRVRVTVVRTSHQTVDHDNLVGGLKPLIDALTRLGLVVDDSPAHVDLVVRAAKGPAGVRVVLEPLPVLRVDGCPACREGECATHLGSAVR